MVVETKEWTNYQYSKESAFVLGSKKRHLQAGSMNCISFFLSAESPRDSECLSQGQSLWRAFVFPLWLTVIKQLGLGV